MGKLIDRTGMRYGRLTVISFDRKEMKSDGKGYVYYWNCKCDCGKNIQVSSSSLSSKQRESCGCLHAERISQSKNGVNLKYGVIPEFKTEKEAISYLYYVTPEGRIFSRCDGRELTVSNGTKGYRCIRLKNPQFSKNKDGRKPYKVHRLVAMFYLPDYSKSLQVNHKNGDKSDNRVDNLEMVTNQQNVRHAWKYLDTNGKRRMKLASRNNVMFRSKWVGVEQIKEGDIIATYNTISSAAIAVNGFRSPLSKCLDNPNRTYKGFQWRRICVA